MSFRRPRHGGLLPIGIDQSAIHRVLFLQGAREVHGNCTFAGAALEIAYGNDCGHGDDACPTFVRSMKLAAPAVVSGSEIQQLSRIPRYEV